MGSMKSGKASSYHSYHSSLRCAPRWVGQRAGSSCGGCLWSWLRTSLTFRMLFVPPVDLIMACACAMASSAFRVEDSSTAIVSWCSLTRRFPSTMPSGGTGASGLDSTWYLRLIRRGSVSVFGSSTARRAWERPCVEPSGGELKEETDGRLSLIHI